MADRPIIHEFSTGIKLETTSKGEWIFQGFTEEYINVTLEAIPKEVERAIANQLFALVEGITTNQPAAIGRVIPGNPDWSVIAVVSSIRDNQGRPQLVYRYLLTEGADNLSLLAAWMDYMKKKTGSFPVFNPSTPRTKPIPIPAKVEVVSPEITQQIQEILDQCNPAIFEPNQTQKLAEIHAYAQQKAGEEPVAWAFNVAALKKPWNFSLIQTASLPAYHRLQRIINPPLIYEFSTGIKFETTSEGGWISKGFTGNYMNVTLEAIPKEVERAIANQLFAVVEGVTSNQPAIIGRVVVGNPKWSVVAVASRGQDDRGRPLSVYRYFLAEGAESLCLMATWMDSLKNKNGEFPAFCPSASGVEPINPHEAWISYTETLGKIQELLNTSEESQFNNKPNFVDPEEDWTLAKINAYAEGKAGEKSGAWAFNVEALEKPWNFTLIHAASSEAYKRLKKIIVNPPTQAPSEIKDEQKLKSALKGLIGSSIIREDFVRTIAEHIDMEPEYWDSLFTEQGASYAIQQKIHSPQMARLLTLRAMLIPETVPQYLGWLDVKEDSIQMSRHQSDAVKFQQDFVASFPNDRDRVEKLYKRIEKGIKFLLPNLLNQRVTPTAVYWLLSKSESGSRWSDYAEGFLLSIQKDVENIKNCRSPWSSDKLKENLQYEYEIWERLIDYYYYPDSPQPYYRPLAELLLQFRWYRLSVYFYQVSQGEVPDRVFRKAFSLVMYEGHYLGISLKKQLTKTEKYFARIIIFIQGGMQVLLEVLNLLLFSLKNKIILVIILVSSVLIIAGLTTLNYVNYFDFSVRHPIQTLTKTIGQIVNNQGEGEEKSNINTEKINQKIIQSLCSSTQHCQLSSSLISSPPQLSERLINSKTSELWQLQIKEYQKARKLKENGRIDSQTKQKLEAEVLNQLRQDIKPNLFPKELAEALNQFSTTRRQIESIVRLTKGQLSSTYSDFPEVIIINAVKTTLLASSQNNKSQLSYSGVIDKQDKSNPEGLKQGKRNWIKAINLYQLHLKDFPGQYGILDDQTAAQLRDEVEEKVKQQLEIPANKLAQADKQFSQTQQGIQSISLTVYNQIAAEPQFRTKLTEQYSSYLSGERQYVNFTFETMIIDKIKESLGRALNFLDPRSLDDSKLDQPYREKWIKAIYIYQKHIAKVKNANGIIAPGSETAQKLINEIIPKVKQKLS
ncbi:MAG: hypothetical protein AB4426_10005 [Xenococcaceae cyanobacterium]